MTSEAEVTPGAVEITVDGATYRIVLPDRDTDYIQGWLAERRTPYEHPMLADMAARLAPGDVVVDVGANIGNHTLYLAAVVGCHVEAFEPDAALTRAMSRSVELNGLRDRVTVHTTALGAEAGTGSLVTPDRSNIGGQRVQTGAGDVPVVPLDTVEVARPVRALKVDVEGMELDVLRGALGILDEDRPLLYVECATESSFGAVAAWLDERGFAYWDTFNATPTHLFVPAEGVAPDRLSRRLLLKTVRDGFRSTEVINGLRTRLDQANLKYRSATQAHEALRSALERAEASSAEERDRAAAELGTVLEDAASLREELARTLDALEASRADGHDLQAHVAGVERQNHELAHDLDAAHREIQRLVGELAAAVQETEAARAGAARQAELRAERAGEMRALREGAERLRADLLHATAQLGAVTARAADLTDSARAAWGEAGALTSVQARLTVEVTELRAALAQSLAELEQARAHVLEAAGREKEAQAREKAALDREATALQEVRDLRGSATFRAGKELRRVRTSPSAALALPARLWEISKETRAEADVPASPRAGTTAPAAVPESSGAQGGTAAPGPRSATSSAPNPLPGPAREPQHSPTESGRLSVAAIVDEFTGLSLAPECDLHHLTPDGWEAELAAARPDLLFVESAWRGKEGAWHNAVGRLPAELRSIVQWCAERGVPTVFWNKEDPVHFSTFLTTARAFDHVFTTDLDCIGRYKAALGHDRVYLLPFACQPRVHHPLEDDAREDAFSFAGSYYRRYPERTRDLDSFLAHLPEFRRVDIFDRNFGSDDENYSFPEAYRGYVVGTLPPEEVAQAYKRYRFGINLNSVKQSQTMFARRVFELLASNTVTVSNFSRGLRVMFGDLVVTTDSGSEAARRLGELAADDDRLDRHRLAALRSVMSQHTYQDRLAYVVAKATQTEVPDSIPTVALIGHARTSDEADRLLQSMRRQRGLRARGVLLVDRDVEHRYEDGVTVLRSAAVWEERVSEFTDGATLVGVLHPDDYYGPHYALDLALGTRYCDADVLGKQTRYRAHDGEIRRINAGAEYRRAGRLPVRSSLVRAATLAQHTLGMLVGAASEGLHRAGLDQVSLDRFGYCENGGAGAEAAAHVDDVELWTGVPVAHLQRVAEETGPTVLSGAGLPTIDAERLAGWFSGRSRPAVTQAASPEGWEVDSAVDDGAYDYLYASAPVPVGELWAGNHAEVYVDCTPGLRLQVVFVFLDEQGERLGNFFAAAAQNSSTRIPVGATVVRVGIRVAGPGRATVRRLVLGHVGTPAGSVVGTTQDLVVTNHYPAYGSLYRNAFVHTRVLGYRELGVRAEVFRFRSDHGVQFDEYEAVDVITGGAAELRSVLDGARHRSVLVHFLDRTMWSVLREAAGSTRVVVWLHGVDVQPWWRRRFNYTSEEEIRRAREISDERIEFWREVFREAPPNVHFVFVSQYLARTAMADVGVDLEAHQYSVIHNPIDVDLFQYRRKDADQRLRVLSIRPFASATYANDLMVEAIVRLSREPWFDELEFRIVGDGPLFDETVAAVRGFANVEVERRFLSHREIAALHQEYGVFLVPTRMDTHGVSRDEAMSSGLVPITTAVAAVPEFVDGDSGILVPEEDPEALALAIARVRADPELFVRLSAGAAARVRRQSARRDVLADELRVVRQDAAG